MSDRKFYRKITNHSHPLSGKYGWVSVHRAVLYDRIGPGEYPCNWCGKILSWSDKRRKIVADHIDGDILNNSPDNLVAACYSCNTFRSRSRVRLPFDISVIIGGIRKRAVKFTCQACGSEDIGPVVGVNKFCSVACASRGRTVESSAIRSYVCAGCGVYVNRFASKRAKFCSVQCYEKNRWKRKREAA